MMSVKRLVLVTALAGLLLGGVVAAEENSMPGIFPYPTHIETLENGLKVILIPMESEGLVAYWSVVRTGSRDEYEPGRTGFAHFFEHMMFKGTEKYPTAVFNEQITKMGADANAYTTDDLTAYHLGVTVGDLEKVIDIESDRFMNLSYSEPAFRTEAGAVYGEYRKNKMNPFFLLFEAIGEKAFTRHTYGHTTMGYERDIKSMPDMFDYSRSFFSRYYRPENVVLLVVGDVEVASTMKMIGDYYGKWEPGYVAPQIPVEPEQMAERKVDVAYEGKSLPILVIGYKAGRFDPSDNNYVAGQLLTDLAFGETSAIHKKLVLDEQVLEFISAGLGRNRDPNLFEIYCRIKDAEKLDYVMSEIEKTLEHYRNSLPDAQRLSDLKQRNKYSFLMNLDTPDNVASVLARTVAVTGGIAAIDKLYAAYDAMTPEDVRAAATSLFVSERRTIGVLREVK
jgi:zinc protease